MSLFWVDVGVSGSCQCFSLVLVSPGDVGFSGCRRFLRLVLVCPVDVSVSGWCQCL